MQARWEEMFGVKEEVVEEAKVKKPRKKPAAKTKATIKKQTGAKNVSAEEKKISAPKKQPAKSKVRDKKRTSH